MPRRNDPAHAHLTTSQPIAVAVVVWLLIQLAPLVLAASRVPLWARVDRPVESYAVQFMLAVQVAASAMLFPWLMATRRSAVAVILVSGVFLQLAGILAAASGFTILTSVTQLWMWLISLALWRTAIRSTRYELVGVALATALSIGAASLIYLQMEFTAGEVLIGSKWIWLALCAMLATGLAVSMHAYRASATGYPQLDHTSSTVLPTKLDSIG